MRSPKIFPASLPIAALALTLSVPFATAAYANIAISIDKSTQHMTVAVDGQQRYVWPVSTGRPGYDTPGGTFKINRMDADHFSQEWDNAPMPHTMFFDLHGHAIHGFFDVKHLGLAVSHGCVRLSPDHAATLFDLVKTEGMANTSVSIEGRTPGGDNVPVARAHLPDNETVYNAMPADADRAAIRHSSSRSSSITASSSRSSSRMMTASSRLTASPVMASALMLSRNRITAKAITARLLRPAAGLLRAAGLSAAAAAGLSAVVTPFTLC